jgi:heme-degrading monooxygenase HmoA
MRLTANRQGNDPGPFNDIIHATHGNLVYDPASVRAPVAIIRGEREGVIPEADARSPAPDQRTENLMFAVIFEVQPKKDRFDDYLDLAKQLKPKLEAIEGFIDIDRLGSKRTAGRVLSLSIWRDEKAVVRWRAQGNHHGAQQQGRFEIFEDYRLRVGEITADTAPPAGLRVEQTRSDETQVGDAKVATITELVPRDNAALGARPDVLPAHLGLRARTGGLVDQEVFESIYNPGKLLLLASWRDAEAASAWAPAKPAAGSVRHRQVRIIRDYGMHERAEAPQFYPDVKSEKSGADDKPKRTAAG